MSKMVLDFAYTEQHEMQKQALTIEKLSAVSAKRILHETLQEKLKQSSVSNSKRKLRK